MTSLPTDLVPIPTSPWDERPDELPLDTDECRTALWLARGNITQAAETLKVTSGRLRRFVKNSAFLSAEMAEAAEQVVDKAEAVVLDALEDMTDPGRRDSMARFVLTQKGADRGFGSKAGGGKTTVSVGNIHITWEGGQEMITAEEEPPTIDAVARVSSNG